MSNMTKDMETHSLPDPTSWTLVWFLSRSHPYYQSCCAFHIHCAYKLTDHANWNVSLLGLPPFWRVALLLMTIVGTHLSLTVSDIVSGCSPWGSMSWGHEQIKPALHGQWRAYSGVPLPYAMKCHHFWWPCNLNVCHGQFGSAGSP